MRKKLYSLLSYHRKGVGDKVDKWLDCVNHLLPISCSNVKEINIKCRESHQVPMLVNEDTDLEITC